jgi:hypothetical protein
MSSKLQKNLINYKDIFSIKQDCYIKGKDTDYGPGQELRIYGETENSLYIPFAYSKQKYNTSPNQNEKYAKIKGKFNNIDYPFRTDGGRDQETVFNQAIDILSKHDSVLLSLFCGFGKCLGYNTDILMYNGQIKKVQDIIIGDLLIGDDSKIRIVSSLARGQSQLWEIQQDYNTNYIVNDEHILSLKLKCKARIIPKYNSKLQTGWTVEWFDTNKLQFKSTSFTDCNIVSTFKTAKQFLYKKRSEIPNVIDIPIQKYINYIQSIPNYDYPNLVSYSKLTYFSPKYIEQDPYLIGLNSYINGFIPFEYKCNIPAIRYAVLAGIIDSIGVLSYDKIIFSSDNNVYLDDIKYLVRSLGYNTKSHGCNLNVYFDESIYELSTKKNIKSLKTPIIYNYIRVKNIGIGDYYGFTLDSIEEVQEKGRFLLGDFTVTHNTYSGIRLAIELGYKTAILVHRGILFDQWEEAIKKFTTSNVQKVDTDGILDPNADFYIFNMAYVHKIWNKETKTWKLKKLGKYKNIGTLIVDEAHIACAVEMSKALLYFTPLKTVALTATPFRRDGLDKALEMYFGKYELTQIVRIAKNPFIVYRLPTKTKPEFTLSANGKKDWNSVITSIVENEDRNNLIIKLIKKYNEYNILVLTKRTEHCKKLQNLLKNEQIECTVMIGTDKTYDKTSRILLSTYSKLGVGFDDTKLNMLIVACSVTEVEQYAGRLRDGKDKNRIIIDLVDDDSNCLKHWQDRRKWYISRNGTIKHYYKEFPDEEPVEIEDLPEKEPQKRLAKRLKK